MSVKIAGLMTLKNHIWPDPTQAGPTALFLWELGVSLLSILYVMIAAALCFEPIKPYLKWVIEWARTFDEMGREWRAAKGNSDVPQ